MKYVAPALARTAFNCPYCHAYAHQDWFLVTARQIDTQKLFSQLNVIRGLTSSSKDSPPKMNDKWTSRSVSEVDDVRLSNCSSCYKTAVWVHYNIVYPQTGEAPLANSDMPEDIRRDYDEASTILDRSPRGAAALIRLAIQKLCKELGQPGKYIDKDIAALVKDGLDVKVQKALDIVRVIGNEAVHPGQIDLRDDRETAGALFDLLNFIVDEKISKPKKIDEMYDKLPESKVKAIKKRDGVE